jgi:hypothetical protein
VTRSILPTRLLSNQPDLAQLKRQATELLQAFLDGNGDARAEVHTHYHGADASGSPVYSAYRHRQPETIALFKRDGGIVGADIAGLFRETDVARQMLEDGSRGPLPDGMVSPGRTLVDEDLLDYGSCGGDAARAWAEKMGHAELCQILPIQREA